MLDRLEIQDWKVIKQEMLTMRVKPHYIAMHPLMVDCMFKGH